MPSIPTPPARVVRFAETARVGLSRLNRAVVPAHVAMFELLDGAWFTQMIYAAAEMGIADTLASGPRSAEQIARALEADPEAVRRLLRALAAHDVFAETEDGKFKLNRLAETLRTGVPNSCRDMARFVGHPLDREHWSNIVDAVRTGEPVIEKMRGMDPFAYLDTEPQLADAFNGAMTGVSAVEVPPIIDAYDFGRYQTIADIGGGFGGLMAPMLTQAKNSRGILFDLPYATRQAPEFLAKAGVADRVEVVHGSFFNSAEIPGGADAYILKHIIHDWNNAKSIEILSAVRKAMPTGAALLLIEMVVPDRATQMHAAFTLDIEMLVQTGGKERTAGQFAELLEATGFKFGRVVETAGPTSVVEARAV